MKRRILLAAGLIGILLVSVLAFTGCGEPEGQITIINKVKYNDGGVWSTIKVVITEKEGGKVVEETTIEANKSKTFTLYPNDYVITATALSPILGGMSGTLKISIYNKTDKKYEVKHTLGLFLNFISK